MSETVDNLILDLLEWIGPGERPYQETMEAWRTSCPRLPVWEDATDLGFIERHHERGRGALVSVSAAGAEHLRKHRPLVASVRRSLVGVGGAPAPDSGGPQTPSDTASDPTSRWCDRRRRRHPLRGACSVLGYGHETVKPTRIGSGARCGPTT